METVIFAKAGKNFVVTEFYADGTQKLIGRIPGGSILSKYTKPLKQMGHEPDKSGLTFTKQGK